MFVFRNTLGFKPHARLCGPVDIDFTGLNNGGGSATDINDKGNDGKGDGKDGNGTGTDGNGDGNGDEGKDGDGKGSDDDDDSHKDGDGKDNDTPFTGGLEKGSQVEFEGQTYTVSDNGDLVDKDGKVFKEAKDIKAWMDSLQVDDKTAEINLENIRKALDIDITDEEGKPVEFTDDVDGIKSYINSAIELKSNEVAQAAVNKVFVDNPILKQFIDYLTVNGGDPRGFGERPDRSGITVDEKSEEQQIAIIKQAAKEFGNASLNDNYIKYLKDSGGLYDEAKAQLANLQAADKQRDEQYAQQAEAQRKQQEEDTLAYWNNVKEIVTNRKIGSYQLPESLVREVNGQKITVTPNDFYDYLSRGIKDEQGNIATAYERALAQQTPEDALNSEILQAWLMYTGGSYEDLVKMAIRDKEVKTIKLIAKENKGRGTVRITKPAKDNKNVTDNIQFS
uniref:Uncharacterized protein n=1 Tax=Geladintestivirus 3 TaxID=3233135 RepID=A0AAU8MGY1_9CAUD